MCREAAEGTASRPPCPGCPAAFLAGREGLTYFRWHKLRGRAGLIHSAAAGHHEGSSTGIHLVVLQQRTHHTCSQKFCKTPTAAADKTAPSTAKLSSPHPHHPRSPTSKQNPAWLPSQLTAPRYLIFPQQPALPRQGRIFPPCCHHRLTTPGPGPSPAQAAQYQTHRTPTLQTENINQEHRSLHST